MLFLCQLPSQYMTFTDKYCLDISRASAQEVLKRNHCSAAPASIAPRGFHVCYIREDSAVPERVNPSTGVVTTMLKPCHKFRMSFDARGPRDDIKVGLAAEVVQL